MGIPATRRTDRRGLVASLGPLRCRRILDIRRCGAASSR